ncbi:MAG TPA: universal stress protein [Flavobacteriales bacterium]|nr:universal stress protein [Flavobacteriales bacterium]HMR26403.1 universal stress protein [Flavobacteriales bacterium]
MARLLLPTDLSDNALNAAVYGIRLMGVEQGHFTLLHTFLVPAFDPAMDLSVDMAIVDAAQEGLARFATRLRDMVHLGGAVLDHRVEHGELPNVVDRLVRELGIELVVMGTQGASGLEETLLGTNAADVIRRSKAPVLAVPAHADYRDPRRIVVADDGGTLEPSTVHPLLNIARWHRAELTIVRGVPEGVDASTLPPSPLDDLLGAVPRSMHYLSEDNLVTALNDLVDQLEADLLVLTHRHRTVWSDLFHRSTTAHMAMHTQVPMLVLEQDLRP